MPIAEYRARFDVKVRPQPNTANISNEVIKAGQTFLVYQLVPDSTDPTNPAKQWAQIADGQFAGKYTAIMYPNNSNPISEFLRYVEVPQDPTPGEAVLTHTIEVYSDGSIKVDGNPI